LRKTECERSRRRIFDLEQRALAPPKIEQLSEREVMTVSRSQPEARNRAALA